ncbi:MAG: DNA translocase FtsK 4TM domain-containing protein [Bacteroidota bacterium]|jgi:S-DNA-T family DNA segregation ATPase FtsK/SpoIIIE|nr:DNA translocase FtsK [Terrimonas sp.]
MANRIKSSSSKKEKETDKDPTLRDFKKEPEAQLDLMAILRDERTWKIVGITFIILSLFLFISFASYLFTWQEDQAIAQQGLSALLEDDKPALNWLGRLGAVVAHFFFFKAFGLASFLVCTFFFVVGVNLLFRQRVFSIWRNLKYVTIGVTVLSVSLSYIFRSSDFSFGGGVGELIKVEMEGLFGVVGTGAILFLTAFAYIIWQFNPSFKWPVRKPEPVETIEETEIASEEENSSEEQNQFVPLAAGQTLNDLYAAGVRPNQLKEEGAMVIPSQEDADSIPLSLVEHEVPMITDELTAQEEVSLTEASTLEPAIQEELQIDEVPPIEEEIPPVVEVIPQSEEGDLELEIKTVPSPIIEEAELVTENLPPYEPTLDLSKYKYPTLQLLEQHGSEKIVHDPSELESNKTQIINTLRNYAIEIQKISATVGPTVTLYEIVPAPGVRISRIKNLEDDIALSLAALGIRIIAPIPGKGTIGIEVPNLKKTIVSMKTLLSSEKFQHNNYSLPIAIGKKIDNDNYIVDLASMPHLLMAGATGQGKSVGLNAILVSLLYKKHPSQLKFVLIDPKKVELSIYRHIERHFLAKLPGEEDAIITDTKKVIHTLNALCIEMDNRYDLLKEAGARNIKEYNEKFINRKLNPQKGHSYLPFIVLVVDEFADLIMTAGKEVEMPIARLAQLARAIGIHLIIATQRPSVNIITGTIKANFPARIAFKVSSKIDSRTILDTGGAEQLIGKGDMLISHNGELTRLQCAFVDTPEVEQVVDFIAEQQGYPQAFLLPEYIDEKEAEARGDFDMSDRDSLFEDAAKLIVQNQVGSTSLLQRRMKLGYNRAGRLMDQLEIAGIVGPSQGSKPRDVLIKTEADLLRHLENMG